MDDLGVLRWFVDAADGGSFTATAAKFRVTPAAVSMGISRLERRLGTRLFHRTTRQLHLTIEGQLYLDKAREGLILLHSAAEQLQDMKKEPNGLIRMSTTTSVAKVYFLPMLADFLAQYPKVSIENSFEAEPPDLIRDGIDIAILRGGTSITDSNYVTRVLCRLPVVLVASPGYLVRRGVPKVPADLASHDWVAFKPPASSPDGMALVRAALAPWRGRGQDSPPGLDHPVRLIIDHSSAPRGPHSGGADESPLRLQNIRYTVTRGGEETGDIAVLGIGIAVSSLNRVLSHLKSGKLKLVLPDYSIVGPGDILLQYPHRKYLSPKTRVFIDFLAARFAAEPALNCDPATLRKYAAY